MRLLLCCESYYPARGGVQEVMRQIAERMVARGHDVTVATSRHPHRKSTVVNGVKIRDFRASGKMPYGLHGEIAEYREFVEGYDADSILIMAAQQWSFDALWPVLDRIAARKVFIPCGFSCLYEPDFADYFRKIPDVLRKIDHLIFNADRYRDVDFVRGMGLTNFTVLPNGVSEGDFEQQSDPHFRRRLGISDEDFVFLTVGNPIEAKGHKDVIDAFSHLDTGNRPATLICVANWPRRLPRGLESIRYFYQFGCRVVEIAQLEGVVGLKLRFGRKWYGLRQRLLKARQASGGRSKLGLTEADTQMEGAARADALTAAETIEDKVSRANAQPGKRVLLTDLGRPDLVQAYMAADLFVFASKIEYSPLVLFEAAAAGVPFLTVPVGNADEIIRWTGGGILCDAAKDTRGYTRVDPQTLASEMSRCMKDCNILKRLGATARERWRKHFTWQLVAGYYEAILSGKIPDVRIADSGSSNFGARPVPVSGVK
jgi:glycosyltransferase involved in cell wall biosynthesis